MHVDMLGRLLGLLRKRGVLRGVEIQNELGISQPVMSRLVSQAGLRIVRFGRSVATRYALPREIPGLGHRVPVARVDEQGQVHEHGTLHLIAGADFWFERASGVAELCIGTPLFMEDMRLQGFMGRGFPSRYPELKLPTRLRDWNDDHHLLALALRGEDCVGNLIIGEESINRFLADKPTPRTRVDYPRLATGALIGQPGSSAGGEHPKFAAYVEGQHVLVKFASGEGAAADRWRDLLVSEHIALEVLREAGVPAPRSAWFDLEGSRFLEVERFDRVGVRGRRGVISLYALNVHNLAGDFDSWSRASRRIQDEPRFNLDRQAAEQMIWLDTFGDLIGNTDRHFGNLSFFAEEGHNLTLTPTPVYDMLPMVFAPVEGSLVERPFTPSLPTALNLKLWHDAAKWAHMYWSRLVDEVTLSEGFRQRATTCQKTLSRLIAERT